MPATTTPSLSVRGVALRRGARTLFSGVDFELPRGQVIVVEAEAGQGATSLLKVCAGLIPPDEGEVEMEGVDLTRAPYGRRREAKRKIGFVFQEAAMIQNLSLFDNVALPLRYHGVGSEEEVTTRVMEVLCALDLEGVAGQRPANLGLQEAHAASLARALGMNPKVIIFDDFFSRLSPGRASDLWDYVQSRSEGPPTALVGTTDRDRVPGDVAAVYVLGEGRLTLGEPRTGGDPS
jgi:phospholipid/cholesterol/gamma-HCH transport system ATP-binding protein